MLNAQLKEGIIRSSRCNNFRDIQSFDSTWWKSKEKLEKDKLTTRDSRVVERKNMVIGKQEEAFNFLKDNIFKIIFYKERRMI